MRIEWQIVFWFAALACLVLLLWLFNGVILPFAAAFVIAYLLDPLAVHLQRLGSTGLRRRSSFFSASSSSSRSFSFSLCRL